MLSYIPMKCGIGSEVGSRLLGGKLEEETVRECMWREVSRWSCYYLQWEDINQRPMSTVEITLDKTSLLLIFNCLSPQHSVVHVLAPSFQVKNSPC